MNEREGNEMNEITCTTAGCTGVAVVAVVDDLDPDYVSMNCLTCFHDMEGWVLGSASVFSIGEYLSW